MQFKKLVTATELARAFKITSGDARHHLTSLEDEGVVTVVDTRVQGRGRPSQLYRLSREITRHNMEALMGAVLKVLLEGVTEDSREIVFQKISACLVTEGIQPKGNLTQRLASSVRHLNEMNYEARWEAHIDAPRILITYCPYSAIVSDHPEICQVDAIVIGDLLGQPVRKISMIGKNETGDKQCIFRINSIAPNS